MPIGKYIYCIPEEHTSCGLFPRKVTNAYRQAHLLYREVFQKNLHPAFMSQMPIGKYIYCTAASHEYDGYDTESQMPIGKYIYCTPVFELALLRSVKRHKCLSASTFTVPVNNNAYVGPETSQMPIGKYIYCTVAAPFVSYCLKWSQMPIGKYIYCTKKNKKGYIYYAVTNAYRQVHLLY